MSFEVKSIGVFERQARRLTKKYISLKSELWELIKGLKEHPEAGTPIGHNCYKIRIAIKSKGKGKSGGGRIITCVRVENGRVYLLTIFDKSEKASISNKELEELLEQIPQ